MPDALAAEIAADFGSYCSYGFDVGRNVAKTLIELGFDARFVRGGIAAWYASGRARALRPTAG